MNLYTYCGNDPVERIDPSGNSWLDNAWDAWNRFTDAVDDIESGIIAGVDEAATFGLSNLLEKSNNSDPYVLGKVIGNLLASSAGEKGGRASFQMTLAGGGTVTIGGAVYSLAVTASGAIFATKNTIALAQSINNGKSSGNSNEGYYKKGKPDAPKSGKKIRSDNRNINSQGFIDFIRGQGKSFKQSEWTKRMETWELPNGRTVERHYWLNKKTGESYYHD